MRILFLHHSTGQCVWQAGMPEWFDAYNAARRTNHKIEERVFPKKRPYGWRNYPYDYWNIWVNHAGPDPFLDEPTLEILTGQYDVIVFKHCFPVSGIEPDTGAPSVSSKDKRLENYKLQYTQLGQKLRSFPDTTFVLWTGAALTELATSRESAERAREFFSWVKDEWLHPGDNVFIWDFFELQTDSGLYLKDEYAAGPYDSHPSEAFAKKVAPRLCERIVDAIERRRGVAVPAPVSVTGKGSPCR